MALIQWWSVLFLREVFSIVKPHQGYYHTCVATTRIYILANAGSPLRGNLTLALQLELVLLNTSEVIAQFKKVSETQLSQK